jgi:hypothetical protein
VRRAGDVRVNPAGDRAARLCGGLVGLDIEAQVYESDDGRSAVVAAWADMVGLLVWVERTRLLGWRYRWCTRVTGRGAQKWARWPVYAPRIALWRIVKRHGALCQGEAALGLGVVSSEMTTLVAVHET